MSVVVCCIGLAVDKVIPFEDSSHQIGMIALYAGVDDRYGDCCCALQGWRCLFETGACGIPLLRVKGVGDGEYLLDVVWLLFFDDALFCQLFYNIRDAATIRYGYFDVAKFG